MNHLFPSSILMFVAVIYAQNYKIIIAFYVAMITGICENQGTCVNCGENRYSYYKCQGMHDCFAGERCTEEGFCCPVSREQPSATALLETGKIGKSEVLRPTPLVDQTTPCPDGSTWLRPCVKDSDCIFGDEICAEGKCCAVPRKVSLCKVSLSPTVTYHFPPFQRSTTVPMRIRSLSNKSLTRTNAHDAVQLYYDEHLFAACNQRRRQVLDELPTNDVLGIHIPQCETNGKYYRAEQCRAGTEECWCVSQFGRMIGSLHSKSNDFGLVCRVMRNSISSEPTWQNEQQILKKLTNRSELRRKQESINPVENRLTLLLTGDDFKTSDKIFNDNRVKFSGEELKKDGGESWEGFTQIIEKNTSQCNLIKDGVCRQQHSIGDDENSTTNCECDSDCFGNQKCCPTGNNSSTCYEPTDSMRIIHFYTYITTRADTNRKDKTDVLTHDSPSAHLVTCGINEQYVKCFDPCQPTCTSNSSTPCPPRECRGGCHCRQGFIRRNTDPHSRCVPLSECSMESIDVVGHCTDSLREYLACGPACPISCATRNIPRELCNKKCKPGCFCKIPYIVENDADPINSRCILPAQCAHVISSSERLSSPLAPIEFEHVSVVQPLDPNAVQPSSHSVEYVMPNVLRYIDPYDNWPSAHTQVFQCIDPLKNFQACGSACPVGCNSRIGGLCSERCVSGCFCRSPYILQDANNLNSGCLLPQQCSAYTSNQQTCSDPRKQWTSCFSVHCARSCANPVAACSSHDCAGGCTCRDPYVLLDARDPNSRCVLPAECASHAQCNDPLKEYQSCASSCPLGCNNRIPQMCTPCASGCFCKTGKLLLPYKELFLVYFFHTLLIIKQNRLPSGFVFEDAVNWRSSRCIPINQCPLITNQTPTTILATVSGAVINGCPVSTNDINGKLCNFDWDCPSQQKCCRTSSLPFVGSQHQRCTCSDPYAIWKSCGSLCPEYCGQPSVPVCSSTCNPGCHCAPGYVKARNDVTAPCVAKAQCLLSANRDELDESTTKPSDPFDAKSLASVQIFDRDGRISGRLRFSRYGDDKMRIKGTVYVSCQNGIILKFISTGNSEIRAINGILIIVGVPPGEHALAIHQYGDTSDACSHVGPTLLLDDGRNASAILGNIRGEGSADDEIAKIIDLESVSPIIGRSLVIHAMSVNDWSLQDKDVAPLACGIIGLTSQ
ncbi:unnamed protein product [Toxocara canis]|uniref:Thyroglobulin type-1 domain-containing protein n=1 Tax=Toxocara canis TaxID=6265 RepID=A0A183UZ95_TOXCA|nr:unnamed protein product [Toxocara canis]